MIIKIYLEYGAIRDDMAGKCSLSEAVGMIQEEDLAEIFVLGGSPQNVPFEYTAVDGGFAALKNLPNISKDITYISRSSDDLTEWSMLRGKSILMTKRPVNSDLFNTISPAYEDKQSIYDKLRKYIHLKESEKTN